MFGFTDNYGIQGDVGDVVGYSEFFTDMPAYADKTGKLYVVVDCPNYGDMVTMTEITNHDWNATTNTNTYDIVDESVQETVEPYKVVLI